MKRSILIISDDISFREWLACIVTTTWPKMMIEYSRLTNAPLYLDRADLDRYQLIIVRTGFRTFAERNTCILLMRILKLQNRPDVVILSDEPDDVARARTTDLRSAYCLQTSQAKPATLAAIFKDSAERANNAGQLSTDGAPQIPGYVIKKPIAATYSATVYLAHSIEQDMEVALKVGRAEVSSNVYQHRLSLRHEYEALRRLGGTYVAKVYDYGEIDDTAYMALEYFPQGTLREYLGKYARTVNRVELMLKVARGMRRVHDAGFLHLDIKPNNILIRDDGSPAFIDFGISKRAVAARYEEGRTFSLGSPYFMSPEQTRGEPLDVRSDIYSFGAVWFRVFTGHAPFIGSTFEQLRLARNKKAPSMGTALERYQPIINKTLAVDRDDRFASADELIECIEDYLTTTTGIFRPLKASNFESETLPVAG